jgi:transglutaminase-like putative cysteine protease
MSWRLRIRHTSAYTYVQDVVASYNEVRLTPQTTGGQVTIDARVEVTPPARPVSYQDYWGTRVHAFDIHIPHRQLVVVGSSTVETPVSHGPTDRGVTSHRAISWAELDDDAVRETYFEYLAPTEVAAADDDLDAIGSTLRREASTPHEALELVSDWVRGALVYEQGSTEVSTSATDAWRSGRGVCQDFVHLAIALLRNMGIPARYASGYFHPQEDAEIGMTVHGESHAWCEAWIDDWWPFDPTNTVAVGERHVLVARGRDYSDVPPLKGIISGAPSTTPAVSVELTRQA